MILLREGMHDSGGDCPRALCSVCNKVVRLRKCGRFFVHGPLEARCRMSDKVPLHLPLSAQNTDP